MQNSKIKDQNYKSKFKIGRAAGDQNFDFCILNFKFVSDGFTLTEVLVGAAVFVIIAIGVYQSYLRLSNAVRVSRAKVVANSILNDEVELIRNLPYQDVGIPGGLPAGKLARNVTTTRSGFEFAITRTIRNIDDPFDGTLGGTPNDTAPADYKLIALELTCAKCQNFNSLERTTTVAAKNLEISSGGGALFIRVIDANGNGVAQANVRIANQKLTPNLNLDDVTNNQGIFQLVDVPPSVGGYNTQVSKSGYSSDATYPPGQSQNPNPVKADSTVLAGQVTQVTFAIDRVSTINLSTTNQSCAVVPNVSLQADGSKLIGRNPDVLKYSQSITTDAIGQRTLSNLEWDLYNFRLTDANYDLAGSIPLVPLNLPPNNTQSLQFLVAAKAPRSLLVTVKDSATGLQVSGAVARLERSSFSVEAVTGRGAFTQTDWSGGFGQSSFIDPARYFQQDGNIETGSSGPGSGGELKLVKIGGDYQPSGWLESSTFDTGSASSFWNISWQPTAQSPETGPDAVKFQVAANNDNTTWNFVGPDGSASTFYTLANTSLANQNARRYLRYRAYLSTADVKKTPNVSDISFTFTSACLPPGQTFFSGLASGTYTLSVSHPSYQTWSNDDVEITADWQAIEVPLSP